MTLTKRLRRLHAEGHAREVEGLRDDNRFAPTEMREAAVLAAMTDGTHWILPAWMGAGVTSGPAPLCLLLFPTYRADVSLDIRPLTPAEAAFHLLQNLVNARNLPDKGVSSAANIARHVPAYQIAYDEATAVAAWIHDQSLRL